MKKRKTFALTEDLFRAIEQTDVPSVLELLQGGQDPNCLRSTSALVRATELGSVPMINLLLQGDADVNWVPTGRRRPLHIAVMCARPDPTAILLRNGANPNLLDVQVQALCITQRCTAQPLLWRLIFFWMAEQMLCVKMWMGTLPSHFARSAATSTLMEACWNKLTWQDVIIKFVDDLYDPGTLVHMLGTCRRLHKQAKLFANFKGLFWGAKMDTSFQGNFKARNPVLFDSDHHAGLSASKA